MKKQKLVRGEYGYLKQKKQGALRHTILMVLIGVVIFVVGLILNKMEVRNVFTIAAICMVLPAAKSFVSVIVLYPFKQMSGETKTRLDSYGRENDRILYDVVFTSSEKVMHLDCIYVTGHQIIGYTSRAKDNVQVMLDYLKKELKSRALSFTVYIATEEKQIKDRMKLRGEETAEYNTEAVEEVLSMLRIFTI